MVHTREVRKNQQNDDEMIMKMQKNWQYTLEKNHTVC